MPPHLTSWRSIIILSSQLCLGLPSGLFTWGFPAKTLYRPLLSPIHATCPTHPTLLDLITWTIFGEQYRSLCSSLCSFLHSPVTLSLVGPNIHGCSSVLHGYTLMFRNTSEYRWCCLVLLLWFYLNLICTDVVSSSTSYLLYGFTFVIFMNCDYNFSCCFTWCEPWSLTLLGEHRLRVIMNKVLRKIWTHSEVSNRMLEKNAWKWASWFTPLAKYGW